MVRPNARPVVSLLTDFGARDPSAGIMRAVVAGIAPDAQIIDISHEVEKFRVRDAALLLWCSVPYLSHGAHVAVVDPGVGTERRAIAIETARGDFLIGPDNGILLPAAARLGGITRAQQLTSPQYRLPVISSSFHGRDIFAPAAAHLAMGLPLEMLGPGLDPRGLVHLDWPEPQVFAGILRSQVIYLDTFGNVKLSALAPDLQAAVGHLQIGERLWVRLTDGLGSQDVEVTWADTFGRVGVGRLLLTEDSYGRLSLAINQGSAVQAIGVREDAEVLVTRMQLPRVDAELAGTPPPAVAAWSGEPSSAAWAPPVDGAWAPGSEQPAQGWGPPPEQTQGWGPPPDAAVPHQGWAAAPAAEGWGAAPEQPPQPPPAWTTPSASAAADGPAAPVPPDVAGAVEPAAGDGSPIPAVPPAAEEPRSSRRWRR